MWLSIRHARIRFREVYNLHTVAYEKAETFAGRIVVRFQIHHSIAHFARRYDIVGQTLGLAW